MTTFRSLGFVCASLGALATLPAGRVLGADPLSSATILGKLHQSNQKEIEMGNIALKNGKSKDTRTFGKLLVNDHTAGDKKVLALAREEKINLAESTPAPGRMDMRTTDDFDAKFSQSMLDDHKKDVAEATEARDGTKDAKLKMLLTDMLPTLQKHRDAAQKLVDGGSTKPAQ